MHFFFGRELRRIVYVCFSGKSLGASTPEELQAFRDLKRLRDSGNMSKVCGGLIALGEQFENEAFVEITQTYLPKVTSMLEGALQDVYLSYSILLWFTCKVCIIRENLFFFPERRQGEDVGTKC